LTSVVYLLQIKIAESAAVFVVYRGGVIEGVAIRATPRSGPDSEPRFANVAVRRVL
jgi:hypothetical protein